MKLKKKVCMFCRESFFGSLGSDDICPKCERQEIEENQEEIEATLDDMAAHENE